MAILSLLDALRRDEGDRQFPYDDATGKILLRGDTIKGNITIGIGRNLSRDGVNDPERALMVGNDINMATVACESRWPWSTALDPVRKEVMLNLIFNMGAVGLSSFVQYLAAMKVGDWKTAGNCLLDSIAYHEEPERIVRLMTQLTSGVRQ